LAIISIITSTNIFKQKIFPNDRRQRQNNIVNAEKKQQNDHQRAQSGYTPQSHTGL
jgi:hypothetical protein